MRKKKTIRPDRSRVVEERHIGSEILDWPEEAATETQIRQALRYYSYFHDHKDSVKWLKTWAKNHNRKELREAVTKLDSWQVSTTLGALAKIQMHGGILPPKSQAWFDRKAQETINLAASIPPPTQEAAIGPSKTPSEIVRERTLDFIYEVEKVVETYSPLKHSSFMEYSPYNELTAIDAPYNLAKAVQDYYKPLSQELTLLVSGKGDDDLKEGYRHLKPLHQKRQKEFICHIIADIERYLVAKKAVRKTRKPRVKSTAQQVSKVQYKTADPALKLVSLPPEKILGAKTAYIFNTRYNTLSYLVCANPKGFSIKGTTIQDLDETLSVKKTIRKAEENIGQFTTGTRIRTEKLFRTLKTKPQSATGRLSNDTIILKVF
jgi:hypothetical protein